MTESAWFSGLPNAPGAGTAFEKTAIARQMKATARAIDALVYELCRLTDEEIRIVEESVEQARR